MLENKNIQDSCFIFLSGGALLCYSLVTHYKGPAVEWKMSPALFPVLISVFLILLSVSLFFDGLRQSGEEKKLPPGGKSRISVMPGAGTRRVLVSIALSIAYFVIMPLITFIPSTVLFLAVFIFFLGERRYWLIALVSVSGALAVWAVFGAALGVMLP